MLAVRNLQAFYGQTQALFDVNLEVRPGEILALVGTNGAGKSTAVRAILGLIKSSGYIEVDGRDVTGLTTHRRVREGRIATVHESNNLFGELTVRENLALGGRRASVADSADIEQLFPVVRQRSNSLVSALSGGQRQMVALAKAMLCNPRYIILDEPSLGLSPALVDEIYHQIRGMLTSHVGILLIEQDIHRAASVAEQLQLVATGRSSPPVDASDQLQVRRLQDVALGVRGQ